MDSWTAWRRPTDRSELRPIYFDFTWHIPRFPNFLSPDQIQEIQCLLFVRWSLIATITVKYIFRLFMRSFSDEIRIVRSTLFLGHPDLWLSFVLSRLLSGTSPPFTMKSAGKYCQYRFSTLYWKGANIVAPYYGPPLPWKSLTIDFLPYIVKKSMVEMFLYITIYFYHSMPTCGINLNLKDRDIYPSSFLA